MISIRPNDRHIRVYLECGSHRPTLISRFALVVWQREVPMILAQASTEAHWVWTSDRKKERVLGELLPSVSRRKQEAKLVVRIGSVAKALALLRSSNKRRRSGLGRETAKRICAHSVDYSVLRDRLSPEKAVLKFRSAF